MSTTVKAGWLKDSQGNKFAPKTMSSQVINDDGTLLKDSINYELDIVQAALDAKSDSGHKHSAADITSGTISTGRLPSASTSAQGIVQLNDSTSSTSITTAATANAVQLAYSKAVTATATANSALDTANGKSTVTESSTNGKVTVNGTDIKVYEHPTTAGNKHIPSGGSNGQVLKWAASGTATWGTDKDTTYSLSSGDNNGTIKVTPSSGSAYNVAVKGLGSVAYTNTVPIANGGTGATTAADAVANLGAMNLTSAQTASGVKTFTNGINIGNALLSYDSENQRLVISVS